MNQNYIYYSDIQNLLFLYLFKFDRDEIRTVDLFLFHFSYFFGLDSARICRYFRLNLLVPRGSIGKNGYSLPPRRKVYSKSQHTSNFHFQYLLFQNTRKDQFTFRTQEKINLHFTFILFQNTRKDQFTFRTQETINLHFTFILFI